MVEFIKGLIYDDGKPSLMDTLSLASFILFAFGSIYLLIMNISWVHYDSFSNMTIGGGGLLKASKYISNTVANVVIANKEDNNG